MVIYMYYHSELIIPEIKKTTNFTITHTHSATQSKKANNQALTGGKN